MAHRPGRLRAGGAGFYIVVIAVALAAWLSQKSMATRAERRLQERSVEGVVGTVLTQLNDVQKRQLDAYLEVNRLLTAFGTTLLGAVGFLLFGQKKLETWTRHQWAVLLGVLSIAVSIFFGYVAYLFIMSMLRDGLFDLTESSPHWAQQAHFYSFLAGVVFLADFVFQNLGKDRELEEPQGAPGS